MQDIYRIVSPAIAFSVEDDYHVSHLVPKGAFVRIESEAFIGDKLVPVLWEEKPVMMFTQDLRSRGVKVR